VSQSRLAVFVGVMIVGASVLLGAWAVWLLADPHEEIHLEHALPGLAIAITGVAAGILIARRG
jgi:hypothetical protein